MKLLFNYIILQLFIINCYCITKLLQWGISVGDQGTTTISIGDTITWQWNDDLLHSIHSINSGFVSSEILTGIGTTYSITFNNAGTFPYNCDIHGSLMQGIISVVAGPSTSPTRLPSLPPTTNSPTIKGPTPPPTTSPSKIPTTKPTNNPTPIPTSLDIPAILAAELTYPRIINSGKTIPSEWSATLIVRQYRHSNSQVSFTTRAYCYNSICSYPGPTIEVYPGDNFTLTLINQLGPQPKDVHIMNKMNGPNTTNIHTHGLHIDPNVDNVYLKAGPGQSLIYKYLIPLDHGPGLMWYHDHHHGSSTLHLMNGLVGALVVKPLTSGVQKIPTSITNGDSALLVVTKLVTSQETINDVVSQGCDVGFPCDANTQSPLCSGTETSSPFNMFRIYSIRELEEECGGDLNINPKLTNPSITNMDLVNGMFRPTLKLIQNSPTYVSVLNAFGGVPLELTISNPSICLMTVIAYDGVYQKARWPRTNVNIPGASRAVIEIICSQTGAFYLYNINSYMMTLYVTSTGTIKPKVTDTELAAIIRPSYLNDLTGSGVVINHRYSLSLSQDGKSRTTCGFWMGTGTNCGSVLPHGLITPSSLSADCPFSQFKGERGLNPAAYIPDGKLVTYVGAINEWKIYGVGSAKHPLHIHLNHVQIISYSSSGNTTDDFYKIGQWRDVIPPVADELVVRFTVSKYTGEAMLHCHFQRHEDLGMMDSYLIVSKEDYDKKVYTSPYETSATTYSPTSTPTSSKKCQCASKYASY